MALIKCPECGKSISDKASKCPHCGIPSEYFCNVNKGGYTDKEAERNILSNPFKRFEDMQMLRHTKTLGIVQVDESVWKNLSKEEKAEIEKICDAKLTEYYNR